MKNLSFKKNDEKNNYNASFCIGNWIFKFNDANFM